VLLFLVALLFSLVPLVYSPEPLASTYIRFDPAIVELGPAYCVNETFTIRARVDSVEDLTGFGLHIIWNTSYLKYVNHIVKVPVETYPDGLLHSPILWVQDEANASEGWYRVAVSTLYGSYPFYGSGIAFEITFRVNSQPVHPEPEVNLSVEFILPHDLASSNVPIPHFLENCSITIYPYPDWNLADINGDLKVDIFDVMLCANAYQATPSDPHWNPRCDLTEPYGKVDIFDIVTICISYGEEYTP